MSTPSPTSDGSTQRPSRIEQLERELVKAREAIERERGDADLLRAENAGLLDQLAESERLRREQDREIRAGKAEAEKTSEFIEDLKADAEQMGRMAGRARDQAVKATARARRAEEAAGIDVGEEVRREDDSYTPAFAFPISHEAIALLRALPKRFDFDGAHGAYAEGQKGHVGELLQELLDEGCIRQVDGRFVQTEHRPFF